MKKVAVACLFQVLLAVAAEADIIYFKDGLKTICQGKAWEEEGRVKCEYGGWIIEYQKSDVLRILNTTPPKRTADSASPTKVKKKAEPDAGITKKAAGPQAAGLVFYDPRRPYKYWTDETTKHKTYQDAIQALAQKYARPAEWVKANMGKTNDLAQIHQNLKDRLSAEGTE